MDSFRMCLSVAMYFGVICTIFELSSLRVVHTYTKKPKKEQKSIIFVCITTTSFHYRRLPIGICCLRIGFLFPIEKLAMHRMKIKWKLFTATCHLHLLAISFTLFVFHLHNTQKSKRLIFGCSLSATFSKAIR